ncbi:hypothetical protein BDFB_011052, partial [Asbolus verrucosus]
DIYNSFTSLGWSLDCAGEEVRSTITKWSTRANYLNFFTFFVFASVCFVILPLIGDESELFLCIRAFKYYFGSWSVIPYWFYFAISPFFIYSGVRHAYVLLYEMMLTQQQIALVNEHLLRISDDLDEGMERYQDEIYRRLRFCIKQHIALKKFILEIREKIQTAVPIFLIFAILGFATSRDLFIGLRKLFLELGFHKITKQINLIFLVYHSVAYLIQLVFILTHMNVELTSRYTPVMLITLCHSNYLNIFTFVIFASGTLVMMPFMGDQSELFLCIQVFKHYFGSWSIIPYWLYFATIPFCVYSSVKHAYLILYIMLLTQQQIALVSEHLLRISDDLDEGMETYQDEIYKRLRFCVKQHVALKKFILDVQQRIQSAIPVFLIFAILCMASSIFLILN